MGTLFLRIATIYLVVGACLGLFMGVTMNFALRPVHAHVLVAGWLSLALIGLIYSVYPRSSVTRLATAHFWLHNLGLPIYMIGLALAITGHPTTLALASGSISLLVGLVLFAINMWLTLPQGEGAA